ncbi:4Fe-4S dicluster domain-containing protein [bacterium]|nr:4Fe-4S dicluster domain-containing protein [bacterium]
MKSKVLAKKDLLKFINKLIKEYDVFAPVKKEEGIVFSKIDKTDDMCLSYSNTKNSVKEFLLPQSEKLFRFAKKENTNEITDLKEKKRRSLLFGVRPCDGKAIAMLDKVFLENIPDAYYKRRRKNTLIIGMACDTPLQTCFCTSVEGGPFSIEGLDALFVELKENYFIIPVTKQCEKLFVHLDNASQEDIKEAEKLKKNAEKRLKPVFEIKDIKEKLDGAFDNPIWEEIHEKCIKCGICTYLCPACHCFDIQDETVGEEGCRVRNWDSCMFPKFTMHASSHNPRATQKERWRQRIMHKFNYLRENTGMYGCVGCGRCVEYCPVNLDIRKVIRDILESK